MSTTAILIIASVLAVAIGLFVWMRGDPTPTVESKPAPPKRPHDITVSTDRGITIFSADTPRGEKYLGGFTRSMPVEEALAYQRGIEAAGLIVKIWP